MINPLLLWFLPLALLPVLLHLITLRRLKTVELSTFRFLMDSYVQQRRRRKLIEWLVMLLRVLFILFIILALTRPVMQRFGLLTGSSPGRDVALVIDTSPTMALRTGGTTSLERAADTARAILELLSPEDYVRLVHAGTEPSVIAQGYARDSDALLEALAGLRVEAATADLAGALELVQTTRPRGSRMTYILSDTMAPAWSPLAQRRPLRARRADESVVVLNLGPIDTVHNLAVVGDAPKQARAVQGLPVLFSATVVNHSPDQPIDTVLSFVLDEQHISQFNLALQPGQRTTRHISTTPAQVGLLRGRFELPEDAFADDNAFLFTLNVQENIRVLLLTGPPEPPIAPTDRPELYLRSALESPLHASAEATLARRAERQLAAALAIEQLPIAQLSPEHLEQADVVVLADVPLNAAHGTMLRDYLSAGGGALILPGPRSEPAAYNEHLLASAEAGGSSATGLTLAAAVGDAEDQSAFAAVGSAKLSHPILGAFDEDEQRYFETVRIYRRFAIEQSDAPEQGDAADHRPPTVLLALPDQSPLLIEAWLGEGRVLLSAVPATPDWSNLPLKPEFVPLLLRAVAHLQRPAEVVAPAAVAPGEPAAIRLTDRWARAQVQVEAPGGRRHTLELHRSDRQRTGALLATQEKGYYHVQVMPRTEGAPERLDVGFAVNLEPAHAELAMLEADAVQRLLGPHEVIYLRSTPDDPLLAEQLTDRREIWGTLIWITFGIIILEFLISTLRPRGEHDTDRATTGVAPRRTAVGRAVDRLQDTLAPTQRN